jgi:RNA polymerase sigma-32 factor
MKDELPYPAELDESTGRGRLPAVPDSSDEGTHLPVPADSFKRYLAEVSHHPLLSREEERELAERVHVYGDRDAAQKLIVSNLRLVVKIALGYYSAYVNIRDMIQEGNIGLMQAVRKYNPYKGTKLSTYASFWIRAYILKYIRNSWSLVKVGTTENQRKLFHSLNKEKRKLEAKGILPARQLLADNLGVSPEEVDAMETRLTRTDVSLDQPVYETGEETLLDMMGSGENVEEIVAEKEKKQLIQRKVAEFKKTLKEKEAYIFENRVMAEEPMTLQQIGEHFSISRERARQIEKSVTNKAMKFLSSVAEPAQRKSNRAAGRR